MVWEDLGRGEIRLQLIWSDFTSCEFFDKDGREFTILNGYM